MNWGPVVINHCAYGKLKAETWGNCYIFHIFHHNSQITTNLPAIFLVCETFICANIYNTIKILTLRKLQPQYCILYSK